MSIESNTATNRHPSEIPSSDLVLGLLLLVMVCVLAKISGSFNPDMPQDNLSYIALAEDLANYTDVGGIYAQRILPPLLVNILRRCFSIEIDFGFRLLCLYSVSAFAVGAFWFLRSINIDRWISWTSAIFLLIGAWPITYNLYNVYQACDSMSYPLCLGIIAGATHRRFGLVVTCSILGALCRQQIFPVGFLCMIAMYWDTRQWRWIWGNLALTLCFGSVVATAGQGGTEGLIVHTWSQISRFDSAIQGFYETRLPILAGPFLLLLFMRWRTTLQILARYWWLTLSCAIIIAQPLFAYNFTGRDNALRLAMMGAWPLYLLAAKLLSELPWNRTTKAIYVLLPVLYGTVHLVSLNYTTPCLIGHRSIANFILGAIVLVCLNRSRTRTQ